MAAGIWRGNGIVIGIENNQRKRLQRRQPAAALIWNPAAAISCGGSSARGGGWRPATGVMFP
jgi:hypothetical protein